MDRINIVRNFCKYDFKKWKGCWLGLILSYSVYKYILKLFELMFSMLVWGFWFC